MKDANLIKRIVQTIKDNEPKTSGYDTSAEVVRVEDGFAWVHIPGGVDETPVRMTINATPGETVQVRVSGGKAFLVGNATSPPTDDKKAVQVEQNLNIVQRVVGAVKDVAETAARIARNTNQYFWFTEEGTDTGAHITEVPQNQFLEDPENGGGNLLARSNGIAVRNGLTEVASFGEEARIGRSDRAHIELSATKTSFYNAMNVLVGEIKSGDVSTLLVTYVSEEVGDLRHFSDPTELFSIRLPEIDFTLGSLNFRIYYNEKVWDVSFESEQELTSPDGAITAKYENALLSVIYNLPRTSLNYSYEYNYNILAAAPKILFGITSEKIGDFGFCMGKNVNATGYAASALGENSKASGIYSHAVGYGTIANSRGQFATGCYNVQDDAEEEVYPVYNRRKFLLIIGNGLDDSHRSNALTVDWNGNMQYALDTTATSGTIDGDLYAAITALGWESEVIVA